MAVRLPQQQYISVQSLGRADPTAPMRSAGVIAEAVGRAGNTLATWLDAESKEAVANGVGEYKRSTNDLRVSITGQDVIDTKDPQFRGFGWSEEDRRHFEKVKDPESGQERTVIAGWRVADRLYDHAEKKIRDKVTADMSGGQRQSFGRQVSDYQIATGNQVVGYQFNGRHKHLDTRYTNAYETSIANGDEQTARITARDAFNSGAWSIERYEKEMQEIGGRIDGLVYNAGLQAARESGDTERMELLANQVWTDPTNRMSGEAKLRFQQEVYNEKLASQKAAVAAQEKARKRRSHQRSNELMAVIHESGYQDWGQLRELTKNLLPEDARTVMTLNSNASYGPERSDRDAVTYLQTRIQDLRVPVEGMTVDQRVAGIRRTLRQAVEDRQLTNADFLDLNGQIDTVVQRPFTDPRIGRVEDRIYMAITKAGKSQFGINTDSSAATRLVEVLRQYHQAIDAAGDQFDPESWYDKNRELVESEAYRGNVTDQLMEKVGAYIIRRPDKSIDIEASRKQLLDAASSGAIDRDTAAQAIDAIQPPMG